MIPVGRFAPSPTGQLHFGSLVAALASFLQARQTGGRWLVRIEDVDEVRAIPGAAGDILRTLEALGLTWQGEVIYQSQRKDRYAAIIDYLLGSGLAYRCDCSRAKIAESSIPGTDGPIYPGTCRNRQIDPNHQHSIRLRVEAGLVCFDDLIQHRQCQDVAQDIGDFVIRRADGFTAYQLAVVVDDHDQGINQVIRGADLLGSTPRQILLQRLLGFPTPEYGHVPLVLGADGRKLSKQDRARPVSKDKPLDALLAAWHHLRQERLTAIDTVSDFWLAALSLWNIDKLIDRGMNT